MEQYNNNTLNKRRLMLGAIFLMVTSAVGPAFLTQTAVFTEQFAAVSYTHLTLPTSDLV